MSGQPRWEPVDDETQSLLTLVANDPIGVSADVEWEEFEAALRAAADETGRINPNDLRPLVRGRVAPNRIGAFTGRAKAEGLIHPTGEWVVSNDTQGRNSGRPCRVYRLT